MDWVSGFMPWITVIVALMYAAFVEWLNHKYKQGGYMSRSHRKNPIVTEGFFSGWSKSMKQKFNRKLRRTTGVEDIPDGNAYRKMNESWDISDYSFRTPWPAYWQSVKHTGISSKEAYAEWKKMYWSK